MSQEANQNINLNVSGAEKVAEATALLQDFQGVIQQVLTNPAYSSYAWNKVAHGLEKAFVDPLKKSVQLTQAQGVAFEKLVSKSRAFITITGFISGMAAALAKTTLEIQKTSAELGKFTSFNNMPGGASSLFQARANVIKMTADNTLQYNSQFAQQTEQVYLELRRKLIAGGMDDLTVKQLTKRLTLLQAGLGVNAPAFVSGLADQPGNRLQGLNEQAASHIFGLLMGEVQKGAKGTLRFFDPQEAAGTFAQGVQQVGGNPLTATRQVLDVMQTYGAVAGPADMQKLFQTLPQFLNEFKNNVTLKGLYANKFGLKESDLEGDKALVNLANLFAREVQSVTGGKPIENTMDYINKGGLVSKTMLERLGIGNDMIQLFNALPKNVQTVTTLSDLFEKLRLGNDALAGSKDLFNTLSKIEKSLENSTDLLEYFGAYLTKITTWGAELGIDPKLLQAAALGTSIGGVLKFSPMMLRSFLKASGVPIASLTKGVGTGTKVYNAATGVYERVAGEAAEDLTKLGKFGKTTSKFARGLGKISGFLTLAIAAYETIDEINQGSEQALSTGEIISNVMQRQLESFSFGLIKRPYDSTKPFSYTDLLMPTTMGPRTQAEQEYVDDLNKQKEEFDQKTLNQNRESLEKDLGKNYKENWSGVAPVDFQAQEKAIINMANLTAASKILGPESDETEPLSGGDIGNLRIIISNDAGNDLANTTLREAQSNGFIRVIMSAFSEA